MSITRFLVPVVIILGIILSLRLAGVLNNFPQTMSRTLTTSSAPTQTSPSDKSTDKEPLSISNVEVSDVTESTATITWTTNEPTIGEVHFGLSDTYNYNTPLDNKLATRHSMVLYNLLANQVYYCKIVSTSSSGNSALYYKVFRTKPRPLLSTYTDRTNSFSISYPQGWKDYPNEIITKSGLICGFLAPIACDGFTSNFNIERVTLPIELSARSYLELIQPKLREQILGYVSVLIREVTTASGTAVEHIYEYELTKSSIRVRALLLCVLKDKNVWNITCLSSTTCWDKYKTDFDTIIHSFKLIE